MSSDKIEAVAKKDFPLSPDGIRTVHVKKGETVMVSTSSAPGMVDAGMIEQPRVHKFDEELASQTTTKSESPASGDGLDDMTKVELEQFARDEHGVELDRRKSKADLVAEVRALREVVAD